MRVQNAGTGAARRFNAHVSRTAGGGQGGGQTSVSGRQSGRGSAGSPQETASRPRKNATPA